ncbi:MAG: glycoside hydrolase N-terminal domain-containing protein [Luteolibacter sp.]
MNPKIPKMSAFSQFSTRRATAGLLLFFATSVFAQQEPLSVPERGVSSRQMNRAWEYGFLTGNGLMGANYFGYPGDETIVMTHAKLFVPLGSDEKVPDIGKSLPELRQIIQTGGYGRAIGFMMAKAKDKGWPGFIQNTDPFHPGFFFKIQSSVAQARDYLRMENFQTGEVAARWRVGGEWSQRRLFVSRPDNVAVLSLTGKQITCDFSVPPIDPAAQVRAYQLNHPDEPQENSAANVLIQQERSTTKDGITLQHAYKFGKGGYDVAIRVIVKGGSVGSDGERISIKDADEVLVLMRIEPFKQDEEHSLEKIKAELVRLPADYQTLLARHAPVHSELFSRVSVDFGGGEDRKLTSEELFERAKQENTISPALLEKIYDGSRYVILCAASDQRPPNLQGIWTGTWVPSWSGDYTMNTNLQLAISHFLSSDTPELLKGYFNLIDETIDGWRENAKKFYGARGIMAPSRESNSGAMIHWSNRFTGSFWTCGAGWLGHWYYDYYLYTGDREFLMQKAIPYMKEVALFYEDFLFTDKSGKYRFSPSHSAENGDGDNSTQDIMVARELLSNLIVACKELKIEETNISKWQAMLDKLPPYLIAANGELQEWSTEGALNKNNHRHMSHLYAIWQSYEFGPATTPVMWKASRLAYEARMKEWFRNPENTGDVRGNETASHGRMHLALSAARFGCSEDLWEILTRMVIGGAIYPSMGTAHYEKGKTFNMDANGAIPEIINNSLIFSLPGQLDLLPALPKAMMKGSVKGIATRGQIKIVSLNWKPGAVICELESPKDQIIKIRLPQAAAIDFFKFEGETSPIKQTGTNEGLIALKAGQSLKFSITYKEQK